MTDDTEEWNQHEDLPILLDKHYFEQKPIDTPTEMWDFKRMTLIYIDRCEDHITHLVRLLATQGIDCMCDENGTSPQCMIHVRDNLPDD